MGKSFRDTVKSAIAKTIPDSARWDVVSNLPKIETWRRKYVGKDCPLFDTRLALYDHLMSSVIKGQAIDYLEFGVYQGESIKYWSQASACADSRFYGFDTFTGLPEDWQKFS